MCCLVLRARHESLVFSYESAIQRDMLQQTGHVWMSVRNDGYIINHLVHHLLWSAKLETVRRMMMLNMNWLFFKTHHLGIDSVLSDYIKYLLIRPDDDAVRAAYQAVSRSSLIIAKQPTQLISQVWAYVLSPRRIYF